MNQQLTLPHWPKELDAHAAMELEASMEDEAVAGMASEEEVRKMVDEILSLRKTIDRIRNIAYGDSDDHYDKLELIMAIL